MSWALFVGLLAVAFGCYNGLHEIAEAIKARKYGEV